MKTLKEQLKSAQRELAMRRNVYPKWVANGRVNQEISDHEIECMQSIVRTLAMLQGVCDEIEVLSCPIEKIRP